MKFLLSGLVALAVLVVPGCHIRHHRDSGPGPARHHHPRFGHVEWSISVGHRHDDRCGHYYDDGRWYENQGHVHRDGCGHVYRGGQWSVDDGRSHREPVRSGHQEWVVDDRHRHDDDCGHYQHKGRWYAHAGHRHGRGCGHHLRSGIWIVID